MDSRTECSRPRPDNLEAKAKAKTIEFCPGAVFKFKASPQGHHPWIRSLQKRPIVMQ